MEEEARYRNYILDKVKYSFSLCEDAGGSDDIVLNVENIAPLLTSLGVHQGESDILDLTRNALVEADGAIDPIDLDKALVKIAGENGDHEELYFDEAFAILDHDNDGYITCADIYRLFQKLEVSISDQELVALVNNIDLDQDGKIGFEDFRDFMVCLKPQLPEPEIGKASSDGNDDDGDDKFEEKKQEDNEGEDSTFGAYKRLRRPSWRKLTREDSQYHLVSEQKRKLLSYVDYVKDAVSVITHLRRGSQNGKAEVVQNPMCEVVKVDVNERTKGVSQKTSEIHERLTEIFHQNVVSSERTERVVANKNTNEAPKSELTQNNSILDAIVTTELPEDMHSEEDTNIEDISDIPLDVDTNITVEQILGNIDVFSNSYRKQRADVHTQHDLEKQVLETEHAKPERELDTASESSIQSLPSHVDLCDYFDPDNMSTSSKNKLFNLHQETSSLNTDIKGLQYEKLGATEAGKLTSMTISPFQLTPRTTKAKVTDLVSMFPTPKTEHVRSYRNTGDNLRLNSPIENVQKHLEDNVDISSNMNNHDVVDCLVVRSCQKSKIPQTQKNEAYSKVDENLTASDFDIQHSRNPMYDFDEIEASEFPEPVEDKKLDRILRAARLENFITGGFSNNVDMPVDGLNKNYGFVQIENFEMPLLSTPRTSRVQTAKTKDKQKIVPIRPKTATSATFTQEPSSEPRDYIIGDALTARHLTTSRLPKSKLRQSLESHNTQDSGYVVGRTWYEQMQSSGDGPAKRTSTRRLSTWQHTFQKAAELSHPQTAESRVAELKRPNTTDSGIASQISRPKSTDTRVAHVSKINAPRKVNDFESERRTESRISFSFAETKSLAYTENEEDQGYSTTNDYRDTRQNHVQHHGDKPYIDDLSHKEESKNSSHYSDTCSKNDTEMFPNEHNRKSIEHVHNPLSTCCGCSLERLQTLYATLNCRAPSYTHTKVVQQGDIPDRPKTAHASLDAPDAGSDHIRFQGDHRRRPKTANFIAMTKIEEGPTDSTEPQRINIRFSNIDLPDTPKDIYTSITDAKIKTSVDTKTPVPKHQTRGTAPTRRRFSDASQITTVQLNIDVMDKTKNDSFIPFLKRPKTSPGRVSFIQSTTSNSKQYIKTEPNQKVYLNSPPIRSTNQRLARSKSDVCNRVNAGGTHNIYSDNFSHNKGFEESNEKSKGNLSRSKSARSSSQIVRVVDLSASVEIEQGFQVSESYSSFKPLRRPFSSMTPRKSKVVENSSLSRSLQTRGILIQHDDFETFKRRPIPEVEAFKVIEPVIKSKHVITLELPRA